MPLTTMVLFGAVRVYAALPEGFREPVARSSEAGGSLGWNVLGDFGLGVLLTRPLSGTGALP